VVTSDLVAGKLEERFLEIALLGSLQLIDQLVEIVFGRFCALLYARPSRVIDLPFERGSEPGHSGLIVGPPLA
jgi:hypothetical protein